MPTKLTGYFTTRRTAELVVERLVQEYQVDRNDITVDSESGENTAGEKKNDLPGRGEADDAALTGKIAITITSNSDETAQKIRETFNEFQPSKVG